MIHSSLIGKTTRLTAENPDVMAKAEVQWFKDSEFFRLLDSEPPYLWSEKKRTAWIEKELQNDDINFIFFSVRTLDADRLIGFIGLADISWHNGDCIAVIALGDRGDWGKGYGTDAMHTLLRYAFLELNLHRVSLIVFEYNQRAQRSYEKSGFVFEGRIRKAMLRDGRRWDWHMMGILREDWLRLQREVL